MPAGPLDPSQEDVFRRVRGLWELMSPERREAYWKHGKALVAAQWKGETRGEFPGAAEPPASRAVDRVAESTEPHPPNQVIRLLASPTDGATSIAPAGAR